MRVLGQRILTSLHAGKQMKYLKDFAISRKETTQMSPSPAPFPSLASHLPPSDIFRGVEPLLQTRVLRPISTDLQKNLFPFTYALPAAFRERPSAAASCVSNRAGQAPSQPLAEPVEEPLQVWEAPQESWDEASSQELGSLSTHLGRLSAELMHITEPGVRAEEGREGERVV